MVVAEEGSQRCQTCTIEHSLYHEVVGPIRAEYVDASARLVAPCRLCSCSLPTPTLIFNIYRTALLPIFEISRQTS